MSVPWQANIVLIGILVFASYVVWGAFADGREAQPLADLGPCGLAQAYADWRVDSDDEPCGTAGVEGADCEAFAQRSRAFEQAAQVVASEAAPPAQATLIDRLRALTGQDADGTNPTVASTDAFMDAFVDACPTQHAELMARVVE